MSNDEDDREMRQASKDNDRFARNKKTPGSLHSKQANTRMNTRPTGTKRGDDGVTLDGYGPTIPDEDVSKQGEGGVMDLFEPDDEDDDPALPADFDFDVDEIARDLLQLDDEDTARAIARLIIRTGDVVGDLAASMEDDRARMNARMNPRAD